MFFNNYINFILEKINKSKLLLTNLPMFTIYMDLYRDVEHFTDREKQFYQLCVSNKSKIEECFKKARNIINKNLQLKSMHVNVLLMFHVFNKEEYGGRVDMNGLKTIKLSRQFLDKLIKDSDDTECVKLVVHEFIHTLHINLPKHIKNEIEADFNKTIWGEEDPSVIFFRKFDTYFQHYWNSYNENNIESIPEKPFNNNLKTINNETINKVLNGGVFYFKSKKFLKYFWNVFDLIAREMITKITASTKPTSKTEHAFVTKENTQTVYNKLMIVFSYAMVRLMEIYLSDKSKLKEVGKSPSSYLFSSNKHILNLFPHGSMENSIGQMLWHSVFGTGVDYNVNFTPKKQREGARPYSYTNEYEYAATAGDSPKDDSMHQKRVSRMLQTGERPTRNQEYLYKI